MPLRLSVPSARRVSNDSLEMRPKRSGLDWFRPTPSRGLRFRARRTRPRLPFINGFCYVIKRRVLEQIGVFDEEHFASGYSEENDFSYRAAKAGFELAVADDAYVYHAKSKSFTFETSERFDLGVTDGQKKVLQFTRKVTVRRPDRLFFEIHGQGDSAIDTTAQYDGRTLTLIEKRDGKWAQTTVPSTLDEMLDDVARRFGLPVPSQSPGLCPIVFQSMLRTSRRRSPSTSRIAGCV